MKRVGSLFLGLTFLVVLVLGSGCTQHAIVGDLDVSPESLNGLSKKSVAIVLTEPDVKDVYLTQAGGRAYKYEIKGARNRLGDALTKILGGGFKSVSIVKEAGTDLKAYDYVIKPTLNIRAASDFWTDACIANLSLEMMSNHTSFKTRESGEFKKTFMSDASSACTEALQKVVVSATRTTLKSLHTR